MGPNPPSYQFESRKKSRIREAKHLSTDADSSINTTVGWTKNTQKPNFFKKTEKILQNTKTQKTLEICQNQRYAFQPEASNPSGSAVSRWTKNTQKPKLFEKQKKIIQNATTQKFLKIWQNQQQPFGQRSLIHLEAWFPPCFVGKIIIFCFSFVW